MRWFRFGILILFFCNVAFAGEFDKRDESLREFKGTVVEMNGVLLFIFNPPLGQGYPERLMIERNQGSQSRVRTYFAANRHWEVVGRILYSDRFPPQLYIKYLNVVSDKKAKAVAPPKERTVLEIFADELAPVDVADPVALHAKVGIYQALLRNARQVARIRGAEGGRAALVRIRGLVLAHSLFVSFPMTEKWASSPEVAEFIEAGANLWEDGQYGTYDAIQQLMEDQLEFAAPTPTEAGCEFLLQHFHEDAPDSVFVLEWQQRMLRALQALHQRMAASLNWPT